MRIFLYTRPGGPTLGLALCVVVTYSTIEQTTLFIFSPSLSVSLSHSYRLLINILENHATDNHDVHTPVMIMRKEEEERQL